MDPPELASEPPRSRIGAASNSARAFKTIGLGNVRALHGELSTLNRKFCQRRINPRFRPSLRDFPEHSTT